MPSSRQMIFPYHQKKKYCWRDIFTQVYIDLLQKLSYNKAYFLSKIDLNPPNTTLNKGILTNPDQFITWQRVSRVGDFVPVVQFHGHSERVGAVRHVARLYILHAHRR